MLGMSCTIPARWMRGSLRSVASTSAGIGSWLHNQQVQRRTFFAQHAPRLREFDQAHVADDASHEAHHQHALRNLIASANKPCRLRRDARRIELPVGLNAVNATVGEHLDLFWRA